MNARKRSWLAEHSRLLFEALRRAKEHQASLFAAGVAFFVFLSLFPGILGAVFAYGLIADAETIARHGEQLARLLPAEAAPIVTSQLDEIAADPPSKLGGGVIVAVVVALYSASRGAFHLLRAVQWMFGLDRVRNTVRQRLVAMSMLAGAFFFFVVSVGLLAVIPPILSFFELDEAWIILRRGRWLFLGAIVVTSIGLLFRLAAGESIRPRTLVSRGVIAASVLWIVISFGFSIYVDTFADYSATYGTLTGVVVLMTWIWVSTIAILFGAAYETVYDEAERGP